MDYQNITEEEVEGIIALHNILILCDRPAALAALLISIKRLVQAQQIVFALKIINEANIPILPDNP